MFTKHAKRIKVIVNCTSGVNKSYGSSDEEFWLNYVNNSSGGDSLLSAIMEMADSVRLLSFKELNAKVFVPLRVKFVLDLEPLSREGCCEFTLSHVS